MFTKLAALPGDRRRRGAPVTPVHCNDNRAGRRLAAVPHRVKRQILLCRWRLDPSTGRLECRWQIEAAGETSAAELQGMRRTSAADLKFLRRVPRVRLRNFKSKSGTRIIELLVPFGFRSSYSSVPRYHELRKPGTSRRAVAEGRALARGYVPRRTTKTADR
jgi:hypothetical protein